MTSSIDEINKKHFAFLQIMVREFKSSIYDTQNPRPGMVGFPEWYCWYCDGQEVNRNAGILHLEKHLIKFENELQEVRHKIYGRYEKK